MASSADSGVARRKDVEATDDFWPYIKQILGTERPDPEIVGHLDGAFFARRARRRLGAKPVGGGYLLKVALDRLFGLVLAIAAAPIMLVIAVLVRVSSPGPIMLRQRRIGERGRPFMLLKFRTMIEGDEHLDAEAWRSAEPDGPLVRLRQDPRVTRVGRFLRRYSLDELPQLLNVVVGDMAVVGPRPLLPVELESRSASDLRMMIKPGITGLWQLSGRYDLTWEESVRLDRRYLENWSFALDLVIVWKTVQAVWIADVRPRGWNEPRGRT